MSKNHMGSRTGSAPEATRKMRAPRHSRAATTYEMNDLNSILIVQASQVPLMTSDNLLIQFNRNAI